MSDTGVGIKATFSVRGQPVHHFSSSGASDSPPPAAAAAGIGEQGPVEGTDKYDYRYTGRHDHGTLPPLKTGGPHGELVKAILGQTSFSDALLAAKADSDAFLTGLISQEQSQSHSQKSETDTNGADRASGGGGGGEGGKEGAEEAEPMELDDSGVSGGACADTAASLPGQGGGALPPPHPLPLPLADNQPPLFSIQPPTPHSAQPAKRPRP